MLLSKLRYGTHFYPFFSATRRPDNFQFKFKSRAPHRFPRNSKTFHVASSPHPWMAQQSASCLFLLLHRTRWAGKSIFDHIFTHFFLSPRVAFFSIEPAARLNFRSHRFSPLSNGSGRAEGGKVNWIYVPLNSERRRRSGAFNLSYLVEASKWKRAKGFLRSMAGWSKRRSGISVSNKMPRWRWEICCRGLSRPHIM